MKRGIKGLRFDNVDDVKRKTKEELAVITEK